MGRAGRQSERQRQPRQPQEQRGFRGRGPAPGCSGRGSAWAVAHRVGWVVLAGLWLLAVMSLVSFSPYDAPSHAAAPLNETPANWCGRAGAVVAYQAYLVFGIGVWVILGAAGAYLVATLSGERVNDVSLRIIGVGLMALSVSGFTALAAPQTGPMPEGSGGLIAIVVVEHLVERFNVLGTALVLLMGFAVGAMLAADRAVMALPGGLAAAWRTAVSLRRPSPALAGGVWRVGAALRSAAGGSMRRLLERRSRPGDEPLAEQQRPSGGVRLRRPAGPEDEPEADAGDEPGEAEAVAGVGAARPPLDAEALREKIRKLPITIAAQRKPAGPPEAPKQDLSGYRFPEWELLAEPESNFTEQMAKLVREQAEVLERALQTYRIDAEVVAIDAGPVITLYEVQLAPGTKVSQITSISSDLARELKAPNIRVVPNTAGKSTVGIEVPNLKKEKVRLRELMSLAGGETMKRLRLPMFLGKDASGVPLTGDLAEMPHMLIAGTTGSGKSVCINSIIVSFLYCRRPDELKMVLVDPKMVEMAQFRDIPHLMCPVVTEMGKAAAILEWAGTKMEERYALLAEAGVRDIDSYNALGWEELRERFEPADEREEARIPRKLPRMVFVIDELADLILTHKEVEGHIVRIAQKARAVGIHLILATQRPQANVVTGLIKSNMPCRVSFKVASGMDSRIVLDAKGAELLLGQGDMLFLSPRTSKLQRAQGTLVDDAEIRRVVKFLRSVAAPSFEPQLIQLKAPGVAGDEPAERDPLFEDAVRVVLESKRGSVSLLQRRLTVGYGRASRLIEEMAEAGIIGQYKGTQSREVNMTLEEWEELKRQAEQEAAAAAGFKPIPADEEQEDDDGDQQEMVYEEDDENGEDEDDEEAYEEYEYEEEEDEEDEQRG